jgi:hypothetical protein
MPFSQRDLSFLTLFLMSSWFSLLSHTLSARVIATSDGRFKRRFLQKLMGLVSLCLRGTTMEVSLIVQKKTVHMSFADEWFQVISGQDVKPNG